MAVLQIQASEKRVYKIIANREKIKDKIILAVDDMPEHVAILKAILEKKGYGCHIKKIHLVDLRDVDMKAVIDMENILNPKKIDSI